MNNMAKKRTQGRSPFQGYKDRIKELETRLKEKEQYEAIKPFIKEFLQNIGVVLAYTKYSAWPELVKIAFKQAAKDAPTAAYIYKQRLPKEDAR